MMILPLVVLAVLGAIVGMIIVAVATSYSADRRFWPWLRGHDASPRAPRACARSLIRPHHAARVRMPMPRPLWIPVATAGVFCGLGMCYAAEPALLLVSLVEATLLFLLLVIDLDQRLVPTPVVGLLAAVALASSSLWPGVGLRDALLGGAVGFAGFAALVGLARLLGGAGALGLGDAYLALAIGCITGYPLLVGVLVLGAILGGLGASILLLLKRVGLRQTIPYGPFLVAATIYVLAHGQMMHPAM